MVVLYNEDYNELIVRKVLQTGDFIILLDTIDEHAALYKI